MGKHKALSCIVFVSQLLLVKKIDVMTYVCTLSSSHYQYHIWLKLKGPWTVRPNIIFLFCEFWQKANKKFLTFCSFVEFELFLLKTN